jgi:hypothetical protein
MSLRPGEDLSRLPGCVQNAQLVRDHLGDRLAARAGYIRGSNSSGFVANTSRIRAVSASRTSVSMFTLQTPIPRRA